MKWLFFIVGYSNLALFTIMGIVYWGDTKPDVYYPTEIIGWVGMGFGFILSELDKRK